MNVVPEGGRVWRNWLWAWLAISLAGCGSTGNGAGGGGTAGKPSRDQVRQQYRTAADHMRAARFDDARSELDAALLVLGGIGVGDKAARQARGLFREESRKNFRGEPYERAMAYYYRGILYWMSGEPDNARACFRSAALQDSDPEQGRYQSDYVLLDYLDGLASAKLAGDGSDALKRAQSSVRLGAAPPAYDPQANVLVFVEMGTGPHKVAMGQHGERLGYMPGRAVATAVDLKLGGQAVGRAMAYDDLTFQATSRGGRVMDHVLANKAGFKEGTDAFGNAALISGAVLASHQGRGSAADEVGAGLLVAGLIGKLVSAATTPRADTREWDNLPNLLGFAALRLPPGQHTLVADFVDPQGRVTASRQATFTVVGGRDVALFFSDRN